MDDVIGRMQRGELRGGKALVNGVYVRDEAHDAVIADIMRRAREKREAAAALSASAAVVVKKELGLEKPVVKCVDVPVVSPVSASVERALDDTAQVEEASAFTAFVVVSTTSRYVDTVRRSDEPLASWYGPVDAEQSSALRSRYRREGRSGRPAETVFSGAEKLARRGEVVQCVEPPVVGTVLRSVLAEPGGSVAFGDLPTSSAVDEVSADLTLLTRWWFRDAMPAVQAVVFRDSGGVAAHAVDWYGQHTADRVRDQTCVLHVFDDVLRKGMLQCAKVIDYPGKDPSWCARLVSLIATASTVAVSRGYVVPWDWYVREHIMSNRVLCCHVHNDLFGHLVLVEGRLWPRAVDMLGLAPTFGRVVVLPFDYLKTGDGLWIWVGKFSDNHVLYVTRDVVEAMSHSQVYLFPHDVPKELYHLRVCGGASSLYG